MISRLPKPLMLATTSNFALGHLIDHFDNDGRRASFANDVQTEWLLGHRMPPFQRPPVWTMQQNVRFIESCWLGLHLGTYVINRVSTWIDGHPHPTDLWLIDGQQRLRALKSYLGNTFPVFNLHWSDLNDVERRTFENVGFACSTVSHTDAAKLRFMYDCLNFGGTVHTEQDRAS